MTGRKHDNVTFCMVINIFNLKKDFMTLNYVDGNDIIVLTFYSIVKAHASKFLNVLLIIHCLIEQKKCVQKKFSLAV